MKKLVSSLSIGVVMLMSSVVSAEDSPHTFSANVTIATDYMFRGISQTGEDPAIQGGFDYSHESGFYLGTWASNLDYPDTSLEMDFYGGISGEFGNAVGWDIGGLYYLYPGSDVQPEEDFFEVYGSLSYDFGNFNVAGGVAYSPDYFGESGDGIYVYGDVGVPLPNDFAIAGHVGHQSIDTNANFGTPDYLDWSIGVSKEIGAFTLDVSYIGTDLDSDAECFGDEDLCSAFVFSVSSSW